MSNDPLFQASVNALKTCMAVKPGEKVLVICDQPQIKIGQSLFEAAKSLNTKALMVEIPDMQVNGEEPPVVVGDMMAKMDAVICPTSKSLTHTDARRNACKAGARVATMGGITEESMIRGMSANYYRIAALSDKLAEILTRGKVARLTTPRGSDITIPIEGINGISSRGLVTEKGSFGNLPSGEAYLMPQEGKSNGVFIVDASMAGIGVVEDDPIEIVVVDGMATEIKGGENARKLNNILNSAGEMSRNLAELGIGTNYMAKICGLILEDEKVLGTAHLALGNNVSMGGNVNVKIHLDGVMYSPTLTIDDQLILSEGKMLIE